MDGSVINYANLDEDAIQALCYMDFHNKFPEYRGLLCYNLNNSKNKIAGSRNKAMGLQPGRSDMVFYWNGTAHMMECKTETGSQSKDQKKWEALIKKAGFSYHIFRTMDEFWNIILPIMQPN